MEKLCYATGFLTVNVIGNMYPDHGHFLKNNEIAVLRRWKVYGVEEVHLSGTSFSAKFNLTAYSGVQSSATHAPACFSVSLNFLNNN